MCGDSISWMIERWLAGTKSINNLYLRLMEIMVLVLLDVLQGITLSRLGTWWRRAFALIDLVLGSA